MFVRFTNYHKQNYLLTIGLLLLIFTNFNLTIAAQQPVQVQTSPLNPAFINYIYNHHSEKGISSAQALSRSETGSYQTGLVPPSVDVFSYLKSTDNVVFKNMTVAPAKFDLRTLNRLTPVKDQGSCGCCWTFATYGSLESNLLPDETDDFSENNLKNTSGFDFGPSDGGNVQMSCAYLARWSGPVNETDDSYNPTNGVSPSGLTIRKHVQNVLFLPNRNSATDNVIIKQALQDYGAVYTTMTFNSSYYKSSNYTYYYPYQTQLNHAVTIVGWDDTFSRYAFGPYTPSGDGAFIVKNSWGTSWGEQGYFYVSYYSNIGKENAVFLKAASTNNYNNIYQYDPLGMISVTGFGCNTAWMANVFTAISNDFVSAVSWYSIGMNSSYQIKIYTDANLGPTSGTLALTQSGTLEYPGYHTVDLNAPVRLASGHKFSVVINVTSPGYINPIPCESPVQGFSSKASASPGQSFISPDGNGWQDLTSLYSNYNVCIKAFSSGDSIPCISRQPVNQQLNIGGTASFTVEANGIPIPTYQWHFNRLDIPGATSATLTIPNVQPANIGTYSVTVANNLGSVISNNATLSINNQAPSIKTQPVSQKVNLGATVNFTVAATGYPIPVYQWYFNGIAITGATSNVLTIAQTQISNIGNYSVVVTNSQGSITSGIATLGINNQAPSIITQPANQQVNLGATATFTATASGYPAPTYQWRFNGTAIYGATSASLAISNVQPAKMGAYTVVATNSQGSCVSNSATLAITPQQPWIITQPANQMAKQGYSATFSVSAGGYPTPAYQWYLNGSAIPGAIASKLIVTNVQSSKTGNYSVTVSNNQGVVNSNNVTLSMLQAPIITTQPVAQTAALGGTAVFRVTASGVPAPTGFQWYVNSRVIIGATSATLTLNNVQASSAGNYFARVSNSQGAVFSNSVALNIIKQQPSISTGPVSQTVNLGARATFTVTAIGYPVPTYQWYFGNTAISGATAAALTIANVQAVNVGNYSVVAVNSQGSATSSNATLNINNQQPSITLQPVSRMVLAGANTTFTVTAIGYPTPVYQWYHDGVAISGAAFPTLAVTNVQPANEGVYSVIVSNQAGSVTSANVGLSILRAPMITSHPSSQTVDLGGTAIFTVAASGVPTPAKFQWYLNSRAISGATLATLTLKNVQASNVGNYYAVVTNSQGSATSNSAALNINKLAPSIITQPVNKMASLNSAAAFKVVAIGYPTPTYQWYFNNSAIFGANLSTLTIYIQPAKAGNYWVVIRNSEGSVTSASVSLSILKAPTITSQPSSQTVNLGGTAFFTVAASGVPAPGFQWYFNGRIISGATSATLTISNVQSANVGNYSVKVSNSQGYAISANAALKIN